MAKESKKSFLDFFKMKDLDDDEFEDDLFDDDDDDDDEDYDDYVASKKSKQKSSFSRNTQTPAQQTSSYQRSSSYSSTPVSGQSSYRQASQSTAYSSTRQQQTRPATNYGNNNKLVDFNNNKQQRSESYRGKSEVYVIKPHEISESQTVTDFLKEGKTIVINMEGLELAPAQRIIDFIGGACYALNGSLQAISANIFIAAPNSIEVSGDLREEILNESTVSPQLGRY